MQATIENRTTGELAMIGTSTPGCRVAELAETHHIIDLDWPALCEESFELAELAECWDDLRKLDDDEFAAACVSAHYWQIPMREAMVRVANWWHGVYDSRQDFARCYSADTRDPAKCMDTLSDALFSGDFLAIEQDGDLYVFEAV